jgi:hypothetical protein
LLCWLWIRTIDSLDSFTALQRDEWTSHDQALRGWRIRAVGRNRFIAPFLVDLIDGSLPSRRPNEAIAPYDRWSRA